MTDDIKHPFNKLSAYRIYRIFTFSFINKRNWKIKLILWFDTLERLERSTCPCGGTGRRAGFKIQYLRMWGFDSPRGYRQNLAY